jgi:hypothetical protein
VLGSGRRDGAGGRDGRARRDGRGRDERARGETGAACTSAYGARRARARRAGAGATGAMRDGRAGGETGAGGTSARGRGGRGRAARKRARRARAGRARYSSMQWARFFIDEEPRPLEAVKRESVSLCLRSRQLMPPGQERHNVNGSKRGRRHVTFWRSKPPRQGPTGHPTAEVPLPRRHTGGPTPATPHPRRRTDGRHRRSHTGPEATMQRPPPWPPSRPTTAPPHPSTAIASSASRVLNAPGWFNSATRWTAPRTPTSPEPGIAPHSASAHPRLPDRACLLALLTDIVKACTP